MANIKSSIKDTKKSEKNRKRNTQVKSSVRTSTKKINSALAHFDSTKAEETKNLLKSFVKNIDKAVKKGIYHWKTAARLKSRLAKKVNVAVAK